MEALSTARTIETARKRAARDAVDPDIASISRENFLRNMPRSRVITIVPFCVLGVCCLQLAQWPIMLALLAFHSAVMGAMWYFAQRTLATRSDVERLLLWRGYRLLSLLSGALWAGCMVPAIPVLGENMAATFVCFVVVVSVTVTAMVIATQWDIFLAFLSGFMLCLVPQVVISMDMIGIIPLIATLSLLPALLGLGDAMRKQDRAMFAIQIERQRLTEQLAQALAASEYLANRDSLTGLYNRRAFEAAAEQLRAHNPAQPYSIVLIDLDQFKAINDRFGHSVGDAVLQRTADEIAKCTQRRGESALHACAVARWGGEEFIVLLQARRGHNTMMTVRRLRAQLILMRDPAWPAELIVTASFGVSTWEPGFPLQAAIARADRTMYAAKRAGGNQIHIDERVCADLPSWTGTKASSSA